MTISVSSSDELTRLDTFLSSRLIQFSRSKIQKLIIDGNITVNKKTVKKNLKLSEKFQQNFGGSKKFSESQNCPNFKSCVGNEPPRSIFLPKKQPNSKNQRILKSA